MSAISLDAPTALALMAVIAITLGALIIFSWAQGRRHFYLALWGAGDVLAGIAAAYLMWNGTISPL